MKNDEKLNVIISKFLSELKELEQNAVSMITITLTIDAEYFPKAGFTEQLVVDGEVRRINEQQGTRPFSYYVTCYEKS
ncbi:hypothetical protein CLV59_11067 [Chitinophaga dinghuensis]|uniref:Uncharacterized protein n=1 Tax=Chitinophaga dinghuensis TaxID=1539050 RepID=A0A327VUY8_9BACT|nr:hypothetical protein [Chitinophaga dinghuensis]RAJ75021.1 hypothetical protein CLV59_11067 [Chitinophaga dinghuensis]